VTLLWTGTSAAGHHRWTTTTAKAWTAATTYMCRRASTTAAAHSSATTAAHSSATTAVMVLRVSAARKDGR
jgi:hypothetical protein